LGGNPKNRSGYIGNGEFKAQGGLAAITNGDYGCGKCDMVSFQVSYVPNGQEAVTVTNNGARFTPQVPELIHKAKPGDQYFFDEVKVRCPGDIAARNLGSLSFTIK